MPQKRLRAKKRTQSECGNHASWFIWAGNISHAEISLLIGPFGSYRQPVAFAQNPEGELTLSVNFTLSTPKRDFKQRLRGFLRKPLAKIRFYPSDAHSGAVGGGNAPISWMPTAVKQEEEDNVLSYGCN